MIPNNLLNGPVDIDCTVIAMTNATKNNAKLKNLAHSISDGGFILLVEDTLSKSSLEALGLKRITKLNVDGKFVLLFRKVKCQCLLSATIIFYFITDKSQNCFFCRQMHRFLCG